MANAAPQAPAPRMASLTAASDAPDVRDANEALLAVAMAHFHPSFGGRLQDLEQDLLVRLEHQRRLRARRRTHVGERYRHERARVLAERAILDPRDFAIDVA